MLRVIWQARLAINYFFNFSLQNYFKEVKPAIMSVLQKIADIEAEVPWCFLFWF